MTTDNGDSFLDQLFNRWEKISAPWEALGFAAALSAVALGGVYGLLFPNEIDVERPFAGVLLAIAGSFFLGLPILLMGKGNFARLVAFVVVSFGISWFFVMTWSPVAARNDRVEAFAIVGALLLIYFVIRFVRTGLFGRFLGLTLPIVVAAMVAFVRARPDWWPGS